MLLGFLNAELNLASVIQIFRKPGGIGGRQVELQRRHLLHYRIEQAAAQSLSSQPVCIIAAVAEEFFEYHLWIVLHGQRRGRSLPGNSVRVRAGVARTA